MTTTSSTPAPSSSSRALKALFPVSDATTTRPIGVSPHLLLLTAWSSFSVFASPQKPKYSTLLSASSKILHIQKYVIED